ncbi:neuropeptide FF receptor 2-like [Montipora capricornis]|uniref:neuropeptide FF receptor 2-like n=1 Tax=Montipora capricornis TaxID=246305 RepID=UPI0035F18F7A
MNSSNETYKVDDLFCSAESIVAVQSIKVSLYVVVMLVSLMGNSFIVAVVCKNGRMRTPVSFFLVNMSVADILITIFYMPRMISRTFLGTKWGISGALGLILCKVAPFTQELSASVSTLTLMVMALDRFFAVLFPFKRIVTNHLAYCLIVVVWLTAVAIRSPMFHGLHFRIGEEGQTSCSLEFDSEVAFNLYVKFAFVMFYVIPLFVIVVLYSAVLISLKNRKPVGVNLSSIRRKYSRHFIRTRKVMNMLFAIVLVFALGWCLHFFLPILFFRFQTKVCFLVFPAFFLGHVTSAINPCIYLLYIENYRRGFRTIFNSLCRKCHRFPFSSSRVEPLGSLSVSDDRRGF